MVAKDEWETGKKLLNIFSPIDGNVLGFPHYRLHRDNISPPDPSCPTAPSPTGMAEAIEMQRQAGHAIYADHLSHALRKWPNPRIRETRNTERTLCKSQFGVCSGRRQRHLCQRPRTESAAYRRLIQLTVDADNKDDVRRRGIHGSRDFDSLDEWIHEK